MQSRRIPRRASGFAWPGDGGSEVAVKGGARRAIAGGASTDRASEEHDVRQAVTDSIRIRIALVEGLNAGKRQKLIDGMEPLQSDLGQCHSRVSPPARTRQGGGEKTAVAISSDGKRAVAMPVPQIQIFRRGARAGRMACRTS